MIKNSARIIGSIVLLPASSAFLSPLGGRHHAQLHGHHDVFVHNNRAEHLILYPTTNTKLHLFGNIFGNDDKPSDQEGPQENELARFSNLLANGGSGSDGVSDNKIDVKFDSLSIMITS